MVIFLGMLLLDAAAAASETLKIGGVGTALGSMKLIAAAFEKSNPGIRVVVIPSLGSSGAAAAVHKGALDIGLMGRPLKEEEAGSGMKVLEYARTPFVVVTKNRSMPTGVTTAELVKFFRGDTKTWPDGKPIRLVLRPASDVDSALAKDISADMRSALDDAHARMGMLTATTDQDNADLIERTPGSLGFSTLTQVIAEHRALKILSFNGMNPSVKTLASGSYPLFKPLFLITKTEPAGNIKKFIDFVTQAEGKKILEASGNLPLGTR